MEEDFNKYMKIIAGKNTQNTQQKNLSDIDKQKISSAYFQLFYNLSFANWLKGCSLGEAWYKAIEHMKAFISTKNQKNPATMYIRQIFAAHKIKWSHLIMTSQNKDSKINCNSEKRQEWNKRVAKNIADSLKIINDSIALYAAKEQSTENPSIQKSGFLSAQQKMQMLIMWQVQKQNEKRAA